MLYTTKCDWSKIFVMYIKRLKNIFRNLLFFALVRKQSYIWILRWSTCKELFGKSIWKVCIFAPKYNQTGLLDLYFKYPFPVIQHTHCDHQYHSSKRTSTEAYRSSSTLEDFQKCWDGRIDCGVWIFSEKKPTTVL